MRRRDVVRALGAAAAVPLMPAETLADLFDFGTMARGAVRRAEPPETLDPHQDATVTALAESILPATDTPGATDALVNEFVDLILTHWFDEEETQMFLRGLADVDRRAGAMWGRVFVECDAPQQTAVMARLEEEAGATLDVLRFWRHLKRLTLAGYFTSEIGQTALGVEIIPGRFDPCLTIPGLDTTAEPGGEGRVEGGGR